MDGMSFARLARGETTVHRRDLPISQGDEVATPQSSWKAIVSSDGWWKYIVYSTGEVELYNLTTDPYELMNLATSNPQQALIMAQRHSAIFEN